MTLILGVLRDIAGQPTRNQILVPGYTCYSVPGSVEKAGLQIHPVDIDPHTLSYDLEALRSTDFSRVLAVVTANLYGLPNDLTAIAAITRAHGVFLVDDAAQSMGAKIGGRLSGTFGDVGLFSLDKGKNITAMQGGILVTSSDDIGQRLALAVGQLPKPRPLDTLGYILKLMVYAGLLHPNLYVVVRAMPFLGLGKTPYTTDYPIHGFSPVLALMAHILFRRLPEITRIRQHNSSALEQTLKCINGLRLVSPVPDTEPAYLRFPVLLEDPGFRNSVIKALDDAGIGATRSYPEAVCDIPELRGRIPSHIHCTPGARSVANRIVTLPTHPYVTDRDIERVQAVFNHALR